VVFALFYWRSTLFLSRRGTTRAAIGELVKDQPNNLGNRHPSNVSFTPQKCYARITPSAVALVTGQTRPFLEALTQNSFHERAAPHPEPLRFSGKFVEDTSDDNRKLACSRSFPRFVWQTRLLADLASLDDKAYDQGGR
jgi:hypothetical protein